MKFQNILVTGGSGFIGSNFINHLFQVNKSLKVVNIDNMSEGSSVLNTQEFEDNKNYIFIKEDINSCLIAEILKENNIDCIVHFAAQSHVDRSIDNPGDFIKTNINGTYNLLEAVASLKSKGQNIHFHHVSTDEVFGDLDFEEPGFKESNSYKPSSPYSASKAASDHLVRAWHKTFQIPVTISNCSNNYGPRQDVEKLIPKTIDNCIRQIEIPIYGKGNNVRDWLFVEDHCRAIVSILSSGIVGESFNIGGGFEDTNINIVTKICDSIDKALERRKGTSSGLIAYVEDRKGHDRRYSIDNSKIKDLLNWTPKYKFSDALEKTINWYLRNRLL